MHIAVQQACQLLLNFSHLQSCNAPNDKQASLRSRETNIQPSSVREKTDVSQGIIPNGREYYDLLLSPFKAIYRFDLYVGKLRRPLLAKHPLEPFNAFLILVE